ncbi:MAG: SDR family oxidoreductase [Burkholderiales bacterium]|nr:SDR family oxidoreductase [Burkholderiales bacterium]
MNPFDNPFAADDRALVTGAGNGIGRAIARALVAAGVQTVFADVNAEKVQHAVATCADPQSATCWVGDLAQPQECQRLLDDAQSRLGTITRFVHAAAPPRREADHALAVDDATWTRMRAVNLDAGFFLGREIARGLIKAGRPGAMLYLTSLHAHTPRNLPHYSTAKAGLAMLVREFAKTFGAHGIRVNALVPGAIVAGGFVADPALKRFVPLGRLGESDDLAPMAIAVLSDRIAGYVSGADIVVDGGLALTNWFEAPDI